MKLQYLKNVTTLKLDASLCIGCGMCVEVCAREVFTIDNKKAKISIKDNCIECGACNKNCPTGAISVDSGVGCAYAVYNGLLTGSKPSCGCSDSGCC
ncbi:MAG TPA: mercury methylation ferredoxin HgcB [Spirochaetota bacterium]|nr:mercury methylation ferredoxin HgcB [Spirochaetota bacterium]